MPKCRKQQILNFSPRQIFDLVADVASYPEFLPWCKDAEIIERGKGSEGEYIIAKLVISYKSFTESYVSKVTLHDSEPPYRISARLVRGPFKYLINEWVFTPHSDGVMVDFLVDFKFKSPILEKVVGPFFGKATEKMTEAFAERAKILYYCQSDRATNNT